MVNAFFIQDGVFFYFFKHIFADTAQGANKVIGKIFKLCAGIDTVLGIAQHFIIFPMAYSAYVFHNIISFIIFFQSQWQDVCTTDKQNLAGDPLPHICIRKFCTPIPLPQALVLHWRDSRHKSWWGDP